MKASNINLVDYIAQELPDLVSKQTCSVCPLAFARAKHEEAIAKIIQKKARGRGGTLLAIEQKLQHSLGCRHRYFP
jgi:hypothetical protein